MSELLPEDDIDTDSDGFSRADSYPLSILQLVNDMDQPDETVNKTKGYITLKNSLPTRCNSVLTMLESFSLQRAAINSVLTKCNRNESNEWEL